VAEGVSLEAPKMDGLDEGRKITFGIRPEHLLLDDTGFEAKVAVVEPTGSETHLVLRAAGREIIAVLRERRPIKPGDTIRLRPQAEMAHLFDTGTGLRLE
jgi:multiple sugar transport system ATP-binding protein